jgi:hypothetical protein
LVYSQPSVPIREADVVEMIKASPSAFDAILLDVDNGPEALIRSGLIWSVTLVTARMKCIAYSRDHGWQEWSCSETDRGHDMTNLNNELSFDELDMVAGAGLAEAWTMAVVAAGIKGVNEAASLAIESGMVSKAGSGSGGVGSGSGSPVCPGCHSPAWFPPADSNQKAPALSLGFFFGRPISWRPLSVVDASRAGIHGKSAGRFAGACLESRLAVTLSHV